MTGIEGTLRKAARTDAREAARTSAAGFARRADAEGILDVAYARLDSPVGGILAAVTSHGLVRLGYLPGLSEDEVLTEIAEAVSPRVLEAPDRLDGVRRELEEYFEGDRRRFDMPIDWRLTGGFGRKVLRATARVGYGETTTYTGVATGAGNPRAYRAAGNALNRNPIPIVVPCHRVLHSGGGLGGYGGGLRVKEFLLRLEGAL